MDSSLLPTIIQSCSCRFPIQNIDANLGIAQVASNADTGIVSSFCILRTSGHSQTMY